MTPVARVSHSVADGGAVGNAASPVAAVSGTNTAVAQFCIVVVSQAAAQFSIQSRRGARGVRRGCCCSV